MTFWFNHWVTPAGNLLPFKSSPIFCWSESVIPATVITDKMTQKVIWNDMGLSLTLPPDSWTHVFFFLLGLYYHIVQTASWWKVPQTYCKLVHLLCFLKTFSTSSEASCFRRELCDMPSGPSDWEANLHLFCEVSPLVILLLCSWVSMPSYCKSHR